MCCYLAEGAHPEYFRCIGPALERETEREEEGEGERESDREGKR